MNYQDTIFALATAPGRAGVAVVRLSGTQAGTILKHLTGRPLPAPRQAALRRFIDPQTGEALDTGLALWFPAPASYTGEDVVELHLHGGPAVIDVVLAFLSKQPNSRPAAAGEFTRRAFEHGKLDLTAIEGLADLLAAETEAQRRQALAQYQGRLGALYEGWRAELIGVLAHIEAHIDFADEELPENLIDLARPRLISLISEISGHLDDSGRGEILRRGLQIAIIGSPNVGKSSLLNALAQRDAAIVTPTPGATRDVIEVHLDLAGYPVTVADTAGLRASRDPIEMEGIRRARRRADQADLKLALFDAQSWPQLDKETLELCDYNTIIVINKIDLTQDLVDNYKKQGFLPLSLITGEGLPELLRQLQLQAVARLGSSETPSLTRERHRRELQDCVACLKRASQPGIPPALIQVELMSEDVRLAARALGRITGRVDVEDLLDIIFADFCIGK